MRRVVPVAGLLALAFVAGGPGRIAGADETEASPTERYAGTWAQLRIQTAVVDLPVLGHSRVKTTTILRLTVTPGEGRSLEIAAEACRIEQDTGVSFERVVFPEELVRRAGRFDAPGSLRQVGDELQFFQPRRWLLFGARLDDVATDELPTDPDDPRVFDQDEDGKPGVTVKVEGLITAEMYLVQRSWVTLRGTATGGNRIDGRIQWAEDHSVLDTTSALLRDLPQSTPAPEPEASTFLTTRIDEDTDCAAIVAARDTLFDR